MSVLILGSAGNLGSQLLKTFNKYSIVAWDRSDFDFLNFEKLNNNLENINPKLIINATAYNSVDQCENEAEQLQLAQRLNIDLVAQLAEFCLKKKIYLMHYSSDYVFGATDPISSAYREQDRPGPVNNYGQTKLGGEKEIARRALLGLNYYIVRSSKLFGPPGTSEHSKPSFFDLMLKISKSKNKIQVVDSELSCFTYTPDLASASLSLWEDNADRGIYHLVNSGPATWYQAALYLFELSKIKIEIEPVDSDFWPRPAKRPKFSVLENTKRPALRSWQEALKDYLKH